MKNLQWKIDADKMNDEILTVKMVLIGIGFVFMLILIWI